jgi:hypothetical protein
VELTPIGIRDATEIERGITAFVTATGPDGGLIMVGPGSSVRPHRELIIALAARHRLPAVYPTHDRFCCRNQDADGAGRLVPFLKPSVVTRGIVRATYARLY